MIKIKLIQYSRFLNVDSALGFLKNEQFHRRNKPAYISFTSHQYYEKGCYLDDQPNWFGSIFGLK